MTPAARSEANSESLAFQFPPYFIAKPANFNYLASLPERLPGAPRIAEIEFRHPSWVRGTKLDVPKL